MGLGLGLRVYVTRHPALTSRSCQAATVSSLSRCIPCRLGRGCQDFAAAKMSHSGPEHGGDEDVEDMRADDMEDSEDARRQKRKREERVDDEHEGDGDSSNYKRREGDDDSSDAESLGSDEAQPDDDDDGMPSDAGRWEMDEIDEDTDETDDDGGPTHVQSLNRLASFEEKWIPFQSDVGNVEFPVSNKEFPISILESRLGRGAGVLSDKYDGPHVMLYVVGEGLGDGRSRSPRAARTVALPSLAKDVIEGVLLRLPAAAQARCRTVCKGWLAELTSPEFLQRNFVKALSRTTPPLCAVSYCPAPDHKPFMDKVPGTGPRYKALKVDLSFVPQMFHSSDAVFHNCAPSGFMCMSRLVAQGTLVCVFNPLNRSLKVLPLLQSYWLSEVALLMEAVTATDLESTRSFKLYVSGVGPAAAHRLNNRSDEDVAIYSSISGEWKGFVRPRVGKSVPRVWACNGDFYTTVDSTPPRLVHLSTEAGPRYLWDLELPPFEKAVALADYKRAPWKSEFVLAGHRGRLLCCCGAIWVLDQDRQLWVQIAERCPQHIMLPNDPWPLWRSFVLKSVHVSGDLVVFFYQLERGRGGHGNLDCPVAYDMLRRCWRQVPKIIAQPLDVFQPMPNLRL